MFETGYNIFNRKMNAKYLNENNQNKKVIYLVTPTK